MIFESYPWKQELVRHTSAVKKWSKKSHTQRGYFVLERGIFLSAFTVRKLIENRKVTDRIRSKSFRCQAFAPFRSLSDRVSRFSGVANLSKEYDFSKPALLTISFFDLTSEIMHSFVFELEVDHNDNLVAFYVNSYRNQDDRVLRVDLSKYVAAVEAVASDDVQEARIWKDATTGRIHAERK